MKGIVLVFSLLLSLQALSSETPVIPDSKRFNSLFRFIAAQQGIQNIALYTLIAKRCARYSHLQDVPGCQKAVKAQLSILDYDIYYLEKKKVYDHAPWSPRSFLFIAFKQNLISLLRDPKTTVFLDDVNRRLNQYMIDDTKALNLLDVAQLHYKSTFEAVKVLAALFQDTTNAQLHLAYLERTGVPASAISKMNKEKLSQVIATINLVLDLSEDNYRKLFYPKSISERLNRNIYHFYVPLYLSMALLEEGIHEQYAFMAPLMLTLTYEFITASNGLHYILKDPEKIESDTHSWKLKDIYGAYCGVSLGTKTKYVQSFTSMKDKFNLSTFEGVKHLLKR